MGKRRKRRIYTCSDKILCGLGRMYAGGGELTENIDDVGGKKSLLRRLVEWAFPNFKINKKEYTVDSYRYVRYQDVTEPEKILQPDDFD